MLAFGALILGFVLLIGGGSLLVRGASEVASDLGISPMVVGLVIVGFGTSAPELVVNISSAVAGSTDLAFGNVVGSNITNLALVLGTAAFMAPIAMHAGLVRRELPLLLLATVAITLMALDGPLEGRAATIGRSDAVILLLLFCAFVYINVLDWWLLEEGDALILNLEKTTLVAAGDSTRFRWLFVIGGGALLLAGGEVTVRSALILAEGLHVSATVVGLFIVAIGTSTPELVTSVIAAMRGESDLALGNVIGSNIFNSLVVLPATGLIAPIHVPVGGVTDLLISLALAAVLLPLFFYRGKVLGRISGGILVVLYCTYAIWRFGQ